MKLQEQIIKWFKEELQVQERKTVTLVQDMVPNSCAGKI